MINKKDEIRMKQKFKQVIKEPCILCGGKAAAICQFIPSDSKLFGGQEGKQRLMFYSLCNKCLMDSQAIHKVESLIFLKYCRCQGSA